MDAIYTLRVGDGPALELGPWDLDCLDLIRQGGDGFHLIHRGRGYQIKVVASDFNTGDYVLDINGRTYNCSVGTPLDGLIQRMGFATNANPDIDQVLAPMPGLLLEVLVQEGGPVKEGDRLLVLEAMKMENIILAPRNGTIKKVHVKKGDAVDKKQLLLEFA